MNIPKKGTIDWVGEWDEERNAPIYWSFSNCECAYEGDITLCGYTKEELRTIYEEHRRLNHE